MKHMRDEFIDALARNDQMRMWELLTKGFDPNDSQDNIPIIILSATLRNASSLKLLVENGASVNVADGEGNCLLTHLSYYSDAETFQFVASKVSDLNKGNRLGITALMAASKFGNESAVKFLLENKVDPNRCDHDGSTALHHAVMQSDNKTVVDLLMEFHADATIKNKLGMTPIDYARILHANESLKSLKRE